MPKPQRRTMQDGRLIAAALALLSGLAAGRAPACDDAAVRDAAFDQPRDVHRLCVIARADDPEGRATARRLQSWLDTSAAGLNVELVPVAADAADVCWADYGIPSLPPDLPVVVLAGRRTAERKSFFIDYWQPAPTVENLEALRSSPAREAIRREVVSRLAVLVYVPGTGAGAGRAKEVIDRVCTARSDDGPLGVSMVAISRTDQRERLLLSFIGVQANGPDWVGVVFGRGKFMAPLQGDEITESRLAGLLDLLVADCTCMQSASRLGVDIPMVWEKAADDAVVRLASGDDPVASGAEPPLSVMAFMSAPPAAASSDLTTAVLAAAFWSLGGLLLLSGIAAAALMWRGQRRDAAGRD